LLLTSATKVILEVSILFKEKCFWSSTRAINTKIGKNGRYTIFNDGGRHTWNYPYAYTEF
jgi:hypothetical protein